MFIIGAIIGQVLKTKTNIENRVLIILGGFFAFIGNVLIGPSPLLHLGKVLWIIIIGGILLGLGMSFSFPYLMPEINHHVNASFPRGREFNNNFSSGMFRFF
jgi:hypothetical protein